MITLTCTKCRATLEMDDAFAGGVCRCQHCGTIQTVPSHLKANGRAAAPVAQKALYAGRTAGGSAGGSAMPSSGLDDLATAVASSGISSGLANRRASSPAHVAEYASPPARTQPRPNRTGLYVGVAAGGAAALGVVLFLLLGRGSTPSVTPPTPTGGGGGPVVSTNPQGKVDKVAGPHFASVPLNHKKIVFVIDRGQSMTSIFDHVKFALFESLDSLGPQTEFQVLFWTAGGSANATEHAYPKTGAVPANRDRVEDIKKQLMDLTSYGSTDPVPAVREALKRNPDAIILITAKGILLDHNIAKQVLDARKGKKTVIHTIDLTSDGDGRQVLGEIASQTGGAYTNVTPAALKAR